jgi:flagellar assembly factor FliW
MNIKTVYAGEVEVSSEQCAHFPEGIPGFPEAKQFAFLPFGDGPFMHMQSLDDEELVFLLVSPFDVDGAYAFDLDESDKVQLSLTESSAMAVYAIVTCGDSVQQCTVNLLAPIVWNQSNRCAKQLVLHRTPYTTKHPLIGSTQEEELAHAGADAQKA